MPYENRKVLIKELEEKYYNFGISTDKYNYEFKTFMKMRENIVGFIHYDEELESKELENKYQKIMDDIYEIRTNHEIEETLIDYNYLKAYLLQIYIEFYLDNPDVENLMDFYNLLKFDDIRKIMNYINESFELFLMKIK